MKYDVEKQKILFGISENLAQALFDNKTIIAGGIVSRLFSGRPTEGADVDVYFRSKQALIDVLYSIQSSSDIVFDYTDKSILVKSGDTVVQLIIIDFFESAEDVFKKFDFTCVMGAFDTKIDDFVFHEDFFIHNSQRKLVFNPGTMFPIISALRVYKYEKEGYKISKNEFVKIALTISSLKIETWEQAEEQLGKFYGTNIGSFVTEELKQEEFSMEKLMDTISNSSFSYEKNTPSMRGIDPFSDFSSFVRSISGEKAQRYEWNGGVVEKFGKEWDYEHKKNPELYTETILKELPFDNTIGYKFVSKSPDGTLRSVYRKEFTYTIGNVKEERNGMWFYYSEGISNAVRNYGESSDRVLIKVKVLRKKQEASLPDDSFTAFEVDVLEVVSEEEKNRLIKGSYSKENEIPF